MSYSLQQSTLFEIGSHEAEFLKLISKEYSFEMPLKFWIKLIGTLKTLKHNILLTHSILIRQGLYHKYH